MTAQSSIHTADRCGREGASSLKTPQKGLIKIEKKTVKHTLRMTEKESQRLKRQAELAGISQAEFVRQKVFGLEPAPIENIPLNDIETAFEGTKSDIERCLSMLTPAPP